MKLGSKVLSDDYGIGDRATSKFVEALTQKSNNCNTLWRARVSLVARKAG